MLALAKGLSAQYQVSVYPDRYYRTSQFKVYSLPMNKLLRSFFKRMRISIALRRQDIVICDSWKSIVAVPARAQKVVEGAEGAPCRPAQGKQPAQTPRARAQVREELKISSGA